MSTRFRTLALASLITIVTPQLLHIAEAQERKFDFPHLRPLDTRIRKAIADGIHGSATFRELAAEIESSDLIIHVEPDCTMRDRVQGKLIFVTAAGGVRYLRMRIACTLTGVRQIAILGHELQHAVEVANAPWVLDEPSLAEEYRRIGFPSRGGDGTAFESRAAIEAGERVLRELTLSTG
jgi:hypothetical protein